jgi:hypothetical protein
MRFYRHNPPIAATQDIKIERQSISGFLYSTFGERGNAVRRKQLRD